MEKIQTLLRYPGGKSRAVKLLKSYIPEDVKEICSPFFGGGSLEIALANEGVTVHGYDVFKPLVEFWEMVINNPDELANEISKYYPLEKEKFYELQKNQDTLQTIQERAAVFYVLNRASFSGSTLSGGMSPNHPRFTLSSIKRIKDFNVNNLTVEHLDFKESIKKHKGHFLYCDPPYFIKSNLYGKKGSTHKEFDHEGLAEILKSRKGWILSYNNCDYIKELYKGYTFVFPEWAYGMSKDKESKEILILNY